MMADDIDDLLDEVELSLSAVKKKSAYVDTKSSFNSSVRTEDLTDLLEDLDQAPPPQLPSLRPSSSPVTSSSSSSRCSVTYLGGTSLALGCSQGAVLRGCDRLRCLGCDLSVVTVEGFTWRPHTDYLFLRTHYPDLSRLRARLDPSRGTRGLRLSVSV